MERIILNEESMLEFGSDFATAIEDPNLTIYLHGVLGAGKTTFARGFLRGLGVKGKVKSPTYTIVEPYVVDTSTVYHFDLYRLSDALELEFIGLDDYFGENTIQLIEWPEKGRGILPNADMECYLEIMEDKRKVKLVANSNKGKKLLESLNYEK